MIALLTFLALSPCADALAYEGPIEIRERLNVDIVANAACEGAALKVETQNEGFKISVTRRAQTQVGFASTIEEAAALIEATLAVPDAFTPEPPIAKSIEEKSPAEVVEEKAVNDGAQQANRDQEASTFEPLVASVEGPSKAATALMSFSMGGSLGVRFSQLYALDADYRTALGVYFGANVSFENKQNIMALRGAVHAGQRLIEQPWFVDARIGIGYAIGTNLSDFNASPYMRVGGRTGFALGESFALFIDLDGRWTFFTGPAQDPLLSPLDLVPQVGVSWRL